jgi:hypothetical protein
VTKTAEIKRRAKGAGQRGAACYLAVINLMQDVIYVKAWLARHERKVAYVWDDGNS